jgi:TRAP-type mannitol/chloroaromatic compound transport system permease small subunit
MSRALLRVAGGIDALGTWVGRAAAWLSLPIVLIIVTDVVSRRLFATGSVMLQELEWHLHAALFLLAAAHTYRLNGHVRIDVLHGRLRPRTRAWIEALGCLIFLLPYCAVIGWLSLGFVARSFAMGEISDAPGGLTHRWVIKLIMPAGFGLLFLQGVSALVRSARVLIRGEAGPGASGA